VNVLLVAPNRLMRESLVAVLQLDAYEIEATDRLPARISSDLLIIATSGGAEIDGLARLAAERGEGDVPMVLVADEPPAVVVELRKAGRAVSVVDPQATTEQLRVAIKGGAGRGPMPAAPGPVSRLERLSEREREVLAAVAEMGSAAGVASRLDISPRTVASHLRNAVTKLQVADVAAAIQLQARSRSSTARPDGYEKPTVVSEAPGRRVMVSMMANVHAAALADALSAQPGLVGLVGEDPIAGGPDLLEGSVDVMLIDARLVQGRLRGLRVVAASQIPVIVVADRQDAAEGALVLMAGARGYASWEWSIEELAAGVHGAALGGLVVAPSYLLSYLQHVLDRRADERRVVERYGSLSSREQGILRLIVDGLSDDDMAERLVVSTHTVRTHVQNILRKLGTRSRVEARAWDDLYGLTETIAPPEGEDRGLPL
jgi:DNA-binding NarL/FixJ family response regulator